MKYWIFLWLGVCALAQADPVTPDSRQTLVASWSPDMAGDEASTQEVRWEDDAELVLTRARNAVNQASQPGYSHLYERAKTLLDAPVENEVDSPELWFLWARVAQHHHDFEAALGALDRVLGTNPGRVDARLLAARIHLIQGNPEKAQPHCVALLGNTDLLTASACALEVASYRQSLQESYRNLERLVERQALPDDARGPWIAQILADMALRLERPEEAAAWLESHLAGADVSYLLQWADLQLTLGHSARVMVVLEERVDAAPAIDDSLALRLAIAERSGTDDRWQEYVHGRMALRLQRQDTQHAADLARYFLELEPRPEKALHWAKINWDKAREHSDRQLLLQARGQEQETGQMEGQD